MTTIALYGGPLKRDIVQLAFEECGQAGYEFELSAEEYDSALRRLNAMLSEWQAANGIALGYNFPAYGNGSADDESGIPPAAVQAVALGLAMRLAPTIGKAMPPESKAALAASMSNLRSTYTVVPTMGFGRNTVRGAGNRYYSRSPFFTTDVAGGGAVVVSGGSVVTPR